MKEEINSQKNNYSKSEKTGFLKTEQVVFDKKQ